MQNPFTSDCPDSLPETYHSRIRWLFHLVLGIGGILAYIDFFQWCLQALIDRIQVSETLTGSTCWLAVGVILLGLYVLGFLLVVAPCLKLADAIFLCRNGKHIYLTRFVFLEKRFRKQSYALHGGQIYDFWEARKNHLNTFDVARDYLTALDALHRKIQEGDIAGDAEIVAETWFFQKKNIAKLLEKAGFERTPSKASRWKFLLFKWSIWIEYLLVGGDWRNLPNVRHVPRYAALAKNIRMIRSQSRTAPDARA